MSKHTNVTFRNKLKIGRSISFKNVIPKEVIESKEGQVPIIDKEGNICSTSIENVKKFGEVFTPDNIVLKMIALIPDEKWADKTFCVIEPTSGNGQFLVGFFKKKIESGLSIEEALNTIIGMEINKETLMESQVRLSELAAIELRKLNIGPYSKDWYRCAARYTIIIENNIFAVDDSLKVMREYGIRKGLLADKKFVFNDPTGNNCIMSKEEILKAAKALENRFRDFDNQKDILYPYFSCRDNNV